MDSSRRRLIVLAVAAPVLTAAVMGALIVRKLVTRPPVDAPPPVVSADPREAAMLKLAGAQALPPDEMMKAADEADRLAGSPLVESHLIRARAARKRGDLSAERKFVDQALALDPQRPEAQAERALAAAEAWARESAPRARVHSPEMEMAAPLLVPPSAKVEPGLEKLTGRAADIVRFLELLRTNGKPDEIAVLWSALSANGADDRLAFAMGVHSLRLGIPQDAIVWLRLALAGAPEDPSRLRAASLAALHLNDHQESLTLVRRWNAAGGQPNPAEAQGWWAVAARQLGDFKDARRHLDEAVKLDPVWLGARAWLAYRTGDKAQAVQDSAARRDSDPWARYLRALLHWEAGEIDASLAECTALLEGHPDHYEGLVLQARGLMALGKNEPAEERWKHALKLAAGRTEAKLGLADYYATTGRREEAISLFLEIPGVADAHWRGASLMLELNRHAEALKWAQVGVERYPDDVRLKTVLARILHARLDHFGELTQLERASKLAPDDPEVKKLLEACLAEMKRE
jgi:tetratricopeptide (TPR) repeat protein